MKLWIFSDLHHDHGWFNLDPPADADVAIAAGDIQNDGLLVNLATKMPVVFVAGNHEFYGNAYGERMAQLQRLPGVHVLNDDTVTFDFCGKEPLRIIGATLWTDYGYNPLAAEAARHGMNDHRYIKWTKEPYQRFLPSHATRLHRESRAYIAEKLAEPFAGKTVVVTHHAPHERSVHPKYAGQLINHAYFSDLTAVIEAGKPDLWVHGHVHSSFDYTVGATRILCNPHGYRGENREFNPALVVEV
jgi:predicted phosphodiesterase